MPTEYDFDRGRRRNDILMYSRMGRTAKEITCPFCGWIDVGFVWSLAGSGKKCKGCGALHKVNETYPVKE